MGGKYEASVDQDCAAEFRKWLETASAVQKVGATRLLATFLEGTCVVGSEDSSQSIITSRKDGKEAVSYTHLTLPTKA